MTATMTKKQHIEPNEAAVSLLTYFDNYAKSVAAGDPHLKDDLAQTAALAVLGVKKPSTLAYFRSIGVWRMLDLVRKTKREVFRPLPPESR